MTILRDVECINCDNKFEVDEELDEWAKCDECEEKFTVSWHIREIDDDIIIWCSADSKKKIVCDGKMTSLWDKFLKIAENRGDKPKLVIREEIERYTAKYDGWENRC